MTRRALSLRCAARRRSPHLDSMQRIATHFAEPRRNDPAFIETFFSSRRYATRLDLVPRFVMLPGSTPGAQVYRFATQFHLSQRHFTTRTATQRPAFIERSSRRAVTPYLSTQRNVAPRYDSQRDSCRRNATTSIHTFSTRRITPHDVPNRFAPRGCAAQLDAAQFLALPRCVTFRNSPRRSKSL
jgi:hypothetical protein